MNKKQSAFTLIELIATIVIVGIAFLSIPIILGVTTKATGQVVDSRAFFHSLAKMKIITSKPWDESNTNDYQEANIYHIIDTAEDKFDCNTTNRLRSGQFVGQNRRMCASGKSAGAVGSESGEMDNDDLDDFNGQTEVVEGFNYKYAVDYVSTQSSGGTYQNGATASSSTTNTKRVAIDCVIRTINGVPEGFALYYYAFNIGLPKVNIKQNP